MSLDMQKSSNCSNNCHVSMLFNASARSISTMAELTAKNLPAADTSPIDLIAVQQSMSQLPT